ncbi:hypothetical protein COCSADRAFT_40000 [Bipolaris sorokiniana ND90Pr]|uniref:Uncharacterized protein n=1 Tax=Cochliobolus sativus (strain ND90Pr / ATCC 201652) TaxID=665912 RepID=M2QZ86_COCSN|nr:uncharacterized protein COCSADRAFT_40000 [Bipolaris sorokiniana ND90Pr]EMD60359.1 hypothetical protein COCSADRAFT_40000 [Bipolaris sorokiniana ND90Pr]
MYIDTCTCVHSTHHPQPDQFDREANNNTNNTNYDAPWARPRPRPTPSIHPSIRCKVDGPLLQVTDVSRMQSDC